jgi:hypothetical protein
MPKLPPRIRGGRYSRSRKAGIRESPSARESCSSKRTGIDGVTGYVVPMHPELATGTLRGILKQAGVSAEEFTEQL